MMAAILIDAREARFFDPDIGHRSPPITVQAWIRSLFDKSNIV